MQGSRALPSDRAGCGRQSVPIGGTCLVGRGAALDPQPRTHLHRACSSRTSSSCDIPLAYPGFYLTHRPARFQFPLKITQSTLQTAGGAFSTKPAGGRTPTVGRVGGGSPRSPFPSWELSCAGESRTQMGQRRADNGRIPPWASPDTPPLHSLHSTAPSDSVKAYPMRAQRRAGLALLWCRATRAEWL